MTPDFLHNYGGYSRSQVVVAPGLVRPAFTVVIARHWLPSPGPRRIERLRSLLELPPDDDAEAALRAATDAALQDAEAPAAAATVPHNAGAAHFRPPMPGTGELEAVERALGGPILADRRLTLAILSRSSGSLFLRARAPRFDDLALDAVYAFASTTFRVAR